VSRQGFAGSVCLVTGATGGIGRAAVSALARLGAEVIASGRDEAVLRELESNENVVTIAADLSGAGAAAQLAQDSLTLRGRVDVLVNCVGFGSYGPFVSRGDATLERLVTVNLVAPIELTRALLPGMLERGSGHVVNVGSIVAHVGRKLEVEYAATKAALAVFSESLRAELLGTGVNVSLVSPGVVDTGFFERRGAAYDRQRPRPVPPELVAGAIVRAIRDRRAEVLVPRWLAVPVLLRGAAPGLYRALARRFDA
jgi:short-subunit dehydrogenase